eukprot:2991461-Pleurochrysis_carterae.AAC.2
MARHNMPTAYVMSGRFCVEQYKRVPDCSAFDTFGAGGQSDLAAMAASTNFGRSSAAGACDR